MMYVGAIIGYLSWPFMIVVSFLAVKWAIKYFEKRFIPDDDSGK